MAALRLLIFKRRMFKLPVGFCHWALFIPGEGREFPDGMLFEAAGKGRIGPPLPRHSSKLPTIADRS